MVCAAPWKTCNCPWFNYQHIEDNDRINDMRVPYTTRRQEDVVEVIEMPDEPSPPLLPAPVTAAVETVTLITPNKTSHRVYATRSTSTLRQQRLRHGAETQ
jgi:hypothetical protein